MSEVSDGPRPELEAQTRLDDLRRTERIMAGVRAGGAVFAVVQVLSYNALPYPAGVREAGLALAATLAVVAAAGWFAARAYRTLAAARVVALTTLTLDVVVASGFVWLYTFDRVSAMWAILFIIPLEGAIRFRLAGALGAWAGVTFLYTLRELWGSAHYDFDFEWNSVSFRMGINLLIAAVAGLMARDLVTQRASVERAYRDLARIDALRARLVSTLAHDVRNPLTSIRAAIITVRDRDLPRDREVDLLDLADRQAVRVAELASDLLDLARLEAGRLDLSLTQVRLREVVERAIELLEADEQVEVRIDPALLVTADPRRLEQVVANLVANALRYGKPPYVTEAAADNGRVRLRLVDHGPGIPPDRQARLFEPFNASEAPGSVGIGLWIVRSLTEAQGGTVSYRPTPEGGACFEVDLPSAGTDAGSDPKV